jgi:hypothetical protein
MTTLSPKLLNPLISSFDSSMHASVCDNLYSEEFRKETNLIEKMIRE